LPLSIVPAKELEAGEGKFREGKTLEEAGKLSKALDSYLSAAGIDDRHAELQFRLGLVYSALANFTEAEKRFAVARDLDTLRFRADDRINEIIRSAAGAAGPRVELIDAEQLFAEASPHEIPGRELFYEHVYMNPHGNTYRRGRYSPVLSPCCRRRCGARLRRSPVVLTMTSSCKLCGERRRQTRTLRGATYSAE
jgi:tetratricopeptide (TPR) repeat protein